MDTIDYYLKKAEEPSPNLMVPPEVSGQLEQIFLLRVTHPDISMKDLKDFLELYSDKYIIKKELSKKNKLHYHMLIENVKMDIEEFRKILKQKFIQLNSGHLYNLEIARCKDNAFKYILKELGELDSPDLIVTNNYDRNILSNYLKQSYRKYSKDAFAKRLDQIEKEYYKKTLSQYYYDYDEIWLLDEYVKLKLEFNQTILWRNACSITEKIHLKRSPEDIMKRVRDEWQRYINPPFHNLNN